MLEFFQRLFESSFMPHGHCYLWQPGLVGLQAGADVLMAVAYFMISYLLFWFVRRRKDLAFKWMFALGSMLFGLCAVTHVMNVWTIWHGTYWLEGSIGLVSGIGSIATAVLLIPVMPKALQLPTPTELQKANEALEEEVEQRREAETELAERARELDAAYQKLKETERLKDEFFANVSHELRTPLTLILSPVESMLEDDAPSEDDALSSDRATLDEEAAGNEEADGGEGASSERAATGEEALSSQPALAARHRRMLETVHNNAVRLLQMVNGLLDFSRLEIGEVEVKREPTRLAALTHAIFEDFGPLIERSGLEARLETNLETSIVEIDRYLYERILFNLLSNAVKFTPEGGRVAVRLRSGEARRQKEGYVELEVEDTGEGIAEEELETIFKDFRQVDASATRRFEGTGLGLSLVKEFTELLGGEVQVESTPGEGSVFRVRLYAPVSKKGKAAAIERSWTVAAQHGRSRSNGRSASDGRSVSSSRDEQDATEQGATEASASEQETAERETLPEVILAEDNEELAAYIEELLAETCRVRRARDGEEALRLLRQAPPEAVITDVMMPRMDGLALCRRLKANPRTADIPVVMLTALTNRKALLRGWEAGADEYLFKPFHPKELITRMRTLLCSVERRREAEEAARRLERELLRASERERRRIGRDLHDGLASHLTGVATLATSLMTTSKKNGAESGESDGRATVEVGRLREIADLAKEGARQARAMARGLNPVKLDKKGLPAALQTLCEDEQLRFEVGCRFEQAGPTPRLSEEAAVHLYWIAHEAVRNAIEHGEAKRVAVRLSTAEGEKVSLEVVDDGKGLPAPVEQIETGMGLETMRYRARFIGAALELDPAPEGGLRVRCILPRGHEEEREE